MIAIDRRCCFFASTPFGSIYVPNAGVCGSEGDAVDIAAVVLSVSWRIRGFCGFSFFWFAMLELLPLCIAVILVFNAAAAVVIAVIVVDDLVWATAYFEINYSSRIFCF